jgi:3-oxoacyl-[acyl-carrier protein] reductase
MSAEALADPRSGEEIRRTIPLGRAGKPEEIAAPVLFLCTEYATFITGEIFNVNGGAVLVG